MKVRIKELEYKYSKKSLYWIYLPLVIVAKIIRYTVLKTTLVDSSVGHYMLISIRNGNVSFELFSNLSDTADASGNAAYLFSFLHNAGLSTYTEYEIFITVVWNVFILFMLKHMKNVLTTYQMMFAALSILAVNIFDLNLAKEPVQIIYFIVMYYILISGMDIRKKYVGVILDLALIVLTFRVYYILVIYFMLVVWFFFKMISERNKNNDFRIILAAVCLVLCAYFMVLLISRVLRPSAYAELIRVRTRQGDASTQIMNIMNSSNLILFCADYILVIVRMLFPIELLGKGGKYIPYILYQVAISIGMLQAMKNHAYMSDTGKLATYICLGFLLASGTFEPDFGSWIRHEAVIFPVMLVMNDMLDLDKVRDASGKSVDK